MTNPQTQAVAMAIRANLSKVEGHYNGTPMIVDDYEKAAQAAIAAMQMQPEGSDEEHYKNMPGFVTQPTEAEVREAFEKRYMPCLGNAFELKIHRTNAEAWWNLCNQWRNERKG